MEENLPVQDERPIADSLKPLLEAAKAERAELANQVKSVRDQAQANEKAAKSKRAELGWLQSLIKSLPEGNARLTEYRRILDEETKKAERYESQVQAQLRQSAEGVEAKLKAVEAEIAQLEQHMNGAKPGRGKPSAVAEQAATT